MSRSAFALGAATGYAGNIAPTNATFNKIAAAHKVSAPLLKKAFTEKVAVNWGAMLLGGGLGLGGLAVAKNLMSRLPNQADHVAQGIGNLASRNMANSSYLQGVRGAWAPAENPFGKAGAAIPKNTLKPPVKSASYAKAAGFMGGLAGAAAGGLGGFAAGGNPLTAIAGASAGYGIGDAAGEAASKWMNTPNNKPSSLYKGIGDLASRNMANSAYLQGIRGAWAPAPNPWGQQG